MNLKVLTPKTTWLPFLALLPLALAGTAGAEAPAPEQLTTTAGVVDLCAEVDDQGHPTRCEPVGPDTAPWWDAEVCCNERDCFEPGPDGCVGGTDSYWCENAVLHGDGSLACVYEVPNYCEVFTCEGPSDVAPPPQEHAICCYGWDYCYDHEGGPCGGDILWCSYGSSNEDGTVTCHQWWP